MIEKMLAQSLTENPEERIFLEKLTKSTREGSTYLNETKSFNAPYLARWNNSYYFKRIYDLETSVLQNLKRLLARPLPNSLSLVTGGPGTGKTYLAKSIVSEYLHKKLRVITTAPTGKATTRLKIDGATNTTLHKLLLTKNTDKLSCDLLVVDECSMIGLTMWEKLFESVGESTALLLLGDPYQLPPINEVGILADICRLPVPCTNLTVPYRYKKSTDQIYDYVRDGNPKVVEMLDIEPLEKFNYLSGYTVITPYKKGPYGTIHYNKVLPNLTPMPVVITENDYHLDLTNGTLGKLWGEYVEIEGRKIPTYEIKKYEKANAISVHKSQGSEFDKVQIILPPEATKSFTRELLYTAVTRTKQRLKIYGSKDTICKILSKGKKQLTNITHRWNTT